MGLHRPGPPARQRPVPARVGGPEGPQWPAARRRPVPVAVGGRPAAARPVCRRWPRTGRPRRRQAVARCGRCRPVGRVRGGRGPARAPAARRHGRHRHGPIGAAQARPAPAGSGRLRYPAVAHPPEAGLRVARGSARYRADRRRGARAGGVPHCVAGRRLRGGVAAPARPCPDRRRSPFAAERRRSTGWPAGPPGACRPGRRCGARTVADGRRRAARGRRDGARAAGAAPPRRPRRRGRDVRACGRRTALRHRNRSSGARRPAQPAGPRGTALPCRSAGSTPRAAVRLRGRPAAAGPATTSRHAEWSVLRGLRAIPAGRHGRVAGVSDRVAPADRCPPAEAARTKAADRAGPGTRPTIRPVAGAAGQGGVGPGTDRWSRHLLRP